MNDVVPVYMRSSQVNSAVKTSSALIKGISALFRTLTAYKTLKGAAWDS